MIRVAEQDIGKDVIVILPGDIKEDGGAYVYSPGKIVSQDKNFVFVKYPGDEKNKLHATKEEWLHLPENCYQKESKLYWKE